MTVRMSGAVAHLEGDWTMSGVMANLDSLKMALNMMESEGRKRLLINCRNVELADTSGLQLLNVWVECARMRGITPKLVNVTAGMRRSINELGLSHLFQAHLPLRLSSDKSDKPETRSRLKKAAIVQDVAKRKIKSKG